MITQLMTLADYLDATGLTAIDGAYKSKRVSLPFGRTRDEYEQLWNLSDYRVCGLDDHGATVCLLPDDGNRQPGHRQAD